MKLKPEIILTIQMNRKFRLVMANELDKDPGTIYQWLHTQRHRQLTEPKVLNLIATLTGKPVEELTTE
jgi:hypothetical protein